MPRKRRLAKRRVGQLGLRDLDVQERLFLICGWEPSTCDAERQVAPRWRSYAEMLDIYEAVQVAFTVRHGRPGRSIFAEALRKHVEQGVDVEAAGAALWAGLYG